MMGRKFLICGAVLLLVGVGLLGMMGASAQGPALGYAPVVMAPEATPTLTPTATATIAPPQPTATATATTQPPPAGCSICSYDAYNCSDFDTQAAAQACHDFCWGIVGYDVHGLDSDDDGVACELLPRVGFGGWVLEPGR